MGMCCQGHSVCDRCHGGLPDPKKCPECRQVFNTSPPRNFALEKIVLGATLSCCNSGCEFVGKASEMCLHKQECEFRPLTCSCMFKGGCTAQVPIRLFRDHMLEHHAQKIKRLSTVRLSFDEAFMDKYPGSWPRFCDFDNDVVVVTTRFLDCNLLVCRTTSQERAFLHIGIFHGCRPKPCSVQ